MASLLLLACGGRGLAVSPVVVIHGEESLAEEGERRFALSLARHAARWFREGGLTVDLSSDTGLDAALRQRRVAVLVHCAQPTAAQLRRLRRFLAEGGRLIVCYSASPALAEMMGLRLEGYRKDERREGLFSFMLFEAPLPANAPRLVRQSSPNVFAVLPLPGRGRVMAWWAGRDGRPTDVAAVLGSPQGFWLTHVLLADGDAAAKGRLLLALAADGDPAIWQEAARARIAAAAGAGPWRGPEDALAAAVVAADRLRGQAAAAAARRALEARQEAWRLLAAGRGAEAWLLAGDLRRQMLEAYGCLQTPRRGEIRAVWDHSGQGLHPGDWRRTCELLADAGISDIFVNVAGPGFTHCRLDTLPASPLLRSQGDQLQECLAAARRCGLRVHAWLICCSTTQATPERLAFLRRRGWLLQGTDGRWRDWLDPAVPEARAMLTGAAGELLRRYRLDGLHLDFVRYPDYHESLGPAVRARFEADRGRPVPSWPDDVRKGPLFQELVGWRCRQVTALVAEMRLTQRREAPGAWLTAAVYGKHPSCVAAAGQPWESWLGMGCLDYAVPMNYTEDLALYDSLLAAQTRTRQQAAHLIGGIGVTAAESRLDAAAVIDQVVALRARGAAGFALFDLDATLEREILPVLRLGISAPPPPRR